MEKTLNNTTANKAVNQVKDLEVWGNADTWQLISKASSKRERWMKSTKAMEVSGLGVLVQVTTQQGENIAEAVTFVPGAVVANITGENGETTERIVIGKEEIDKMVEKAIEDGTIEPEADDDNPPEDNEDTVDTDTAEDPVE